MGARVVVVVAALLAAACGDDAAPDAGPIPDAAVEQCEIQPRDYCEVINSPPPDCYGDPCPCGSEKVYQEWDDCDCYQCRFRYYCECRPS